MNAPVTTRDPGLLDDLERLARVRVFFAHRSVGSGLLDGVRAIAAEEGDDTLRLVEVAEELPPCVFGHALLPDSGDPLVKLREFERMLRSGIGSVAEIVMFKFCYVDITARSDAAWLFRSYDRTMRGLRDTYRSVTFVHLTAPLTTVRAGAGARAAVSGLLRRTPDALVDNSRREEFNELMRRAYAGREPLFDLASAESTAPNGAREVHDLHGRPIAALSPAYTTDGGHLNALGRTRIARGLVAMLASLAGDA